MELISEHIKNMTTVPKEQMSRLFRMQIHASIAGISLGAVWAISFMGIYKRATEVILENDSYAMLAAIICLGCFVASAIIATNHSSEENREGKTNAECGWLLRTCSFLTVLGMCILIIGSAGIKSPFMPLYIMTFTLTLENLAPDTSKFRFASFFVIATTIACLIAHYFPIINPIFISKIADDGFMVASIAIGLVASFIVPAVSAHLVASARAKHEGR